MGSTTTASGGAASVAIFDGSGALLVEQVASVVPESPDDNKATGLFTTPILFENIEDVAIKVST